MVRCLSESQRVKAGGGLCGGVLQRVNARVEPWVRAGVGSPGLVPTGLVVLETTGRRSGETYRTPLLATVDLGGYLWVSTVLGRRANWLRNAQAHPEVRYWLKGAVHEGRALVSMPGGPMPDLSELPTLTRWAASRAIRVARAVQFGMLIIVPKVDDGDRSTQR